MQNSILYAFFVHGVTEVARTLLRSLPHVHGLVREHGASLSFLFSSESCRMAFAHVAPAYPQEEPQTWRVLHQLRGTCAVKHFPRSAIVRRPLHGLPGASWPTPKLVPVSEAVKTSQAGRGTGLEICCHAAFCGVKS